MEQNSVLGINDVNRRQEIAFDVDVFKEILSNPLEKIDFPYRILYEILNFIRKYHNIVFNKKWLEEIEMIGDLITDQNTRKYFMQLLLTDLKVENSSVNKNDKTDDYIYNIAKYLQQKILITNKNKDTDYKLNTYSDIQFVSDNYKNDCVLFRLPKTLEYTYDEELENFNFLGFYLKDCSLIEFVDKYIDDSSVEFIFSILNQLDKDTKVYLHYDILNSTFFKYEDFRKNAKAKYPNLKFYKKPIPYIKEKKHDRLIIIGKNKYSIKFTTSFNNIEKNEGKYKVKKSFTIIIKEGRLY
jgi:hypothetical protein